MTPTLTNFKGPPISICYRSISVITNVENKEKLFREPKNGFCYRRITGGSIKAGFNCTNVCKILNKKPG